MTICLNVTERGLRKGLKDREMAGEKEAAMLPAKDREANPVGERENAKGGQERKK